jgi:hypothetical protein
MRVHFAALVVNAAMEHMREPDTGWSVTWTERMGQVATCELPYEQALEVALQCVEVAERHSSVQPPLSPADPDALLDIGVRLASTLECEVRLAVYSLYHGDVPVAHAEAVGQLLDCGRRADSPA